MRMSGRVRELADAARQWYAENGRPWFYARQIGRAGTGGRNSARRRNGIFLPTTSRSIRGGAGGQSGAGRGERGQGMRGTRATALAGVEAGRIFLSWKCSARRSSSIWSRSPADRICGWADQNGAAALPHYSPGYSGWDISDQIKLWNLIRQTGARHFNGKLEVLETGMLRPKKSLLAVFGVTRNLEKARSLAKLIPCENCSLPNCQYRRAPYRHAPPQIEDVRALLASAFDGFNRQKNISVLNSNAKYSINPRALEKWANERLQLESTGDGSIEARFRYEGTTCSNMGRALEFDYRVKLAPPGDDYRILEMDLRARVRRHRPPAFNASI